MRTAGRVVVGLICVAALVPPVWATVENLKSYKQAYPDKDPKTVSCKTCHTAAMGNATNLNGYGKALKQLPAPANPKKLTVDDFRVAETADPDGDGATTKQELEAGTDPSDPASVPAAAALGSSTPSPSPTAAPAAATGRGQSGAPADTGKQ